MFVNNVYKRVNLTLDACYVQNSEIILIAALVLQFTFKTHYKDFPVTICIYALRSNIDE